MQGRPHEGQLLRHHAGEAGRADCLLGGATYSTADTVRPALQLVKTKPGSKSVSSCFVLVREKADGSEEKYVMGDCAINIEPTAEEMAECAVECARTAQIFGIDPKGGHAELLHQGLRQGREGGQGGGGPEAGPRPPPPSWPSTASCSSTPAFSPVVAQTKCKGSPVAGQANVFIFPEIQSGNIGYKIAQRLGGFAAYGPILQGLNAPINDLSRGCDAEEVYNMAIITAGLK